MAKMLDISILNIDKVVVSEKQQEDFLKSAMTIEEKTDGTKLTLIRTSEKFNSNIVSNFIISYKNNVMIPEEYEGIDRKKIKDESIGTSQYSFIVDHLQTLSSSDVKKIPINTEFFIEYLMNKPTLTRDYKFKHGMILIAHAKTKYRLTKGKVTSKPDGFHQDKLDTFAKLLKLDVPVQLFDGKPTTNDMLIKGSKSKVWTTQVARVLPFHAENTTTENFQAFKNFILSIESKYGGKTEGVVIKIGDKILKVLQADQHDVGVRNDRKLKYKMSPERETEYWADIHSMADDIVNHDINYEQRYEQIMASLSSICYVTESLPDHEKKTQLNIQDDLFLTVKTKVMKRLPGNNNALFIGRLQPPTKLHMQIIETGLSRFDNVVVGLVKGKKSDKAKNPFPFELQERMLLAKFPNLEVIEVGNGNIIGILNKVDININAVLAGSDRVKGYENQLKRMPDMYVSETERDFSGVSGTKAREAIQARDIAKFTQNMDITSLPFFKELTNFFFQEESLENHISFNDFLSINS